MLGKQIQNTQVPEHQHTQSLKLGDLGNYNNLVHLKRYQRVGIFCIRKIFGFFV